MFRFFFVTMRGRHKRDRSTRIIHIREKGGRREQADGWWQLHARTHAGCICTQGGTPPREVFQEVSGYSRLTDSQMWYLSRRNFTPDGRLIMSLLTYDGQCTVAFIFSNVSTLVSFVFCMVDGVAGNDVSGCVLNRDIIRFVV